MRSQALLPELPAEYYYRSRVWELQRSKNPPSLLPELSSKRVLLFQLTLDHFPALHATLQRSTLVADNHEWDRERWSDPLRYPDELHV